MRIGLDLDIPTALQQQPIEVENPQPSQALFVDSERFGPAVATTLWPIARERHYVELKGAAASVVDSIAFEVR